MSNIAIEKNIDCIMTAYIEDAFFHLVEDKTLFSAWDATIQRYDANSFKINFAKSLISTLAKHQHLTLDEI
jgi:hypothetical protein